LNATAMITDVIIWLWGPPESRMSNLSKQGLVLSM